MNYVNAIILGLVQGLTEFLPISSSGHLAIFERLLSDSAVKSSLTMEILLHFGTLMAVMFVFRKDIGLLIIETLNMLKALPKGRLQLDKYPYRRMALMLIIASIPAALCGFLFKSYVAQASDNMLFVGCALLFTAVILWWSTKLASGKQEMHNMTTSSALLIGLCQAVAILPGISRSGMTIVGGLFAGLKREFAVNFAFLMSIPIILGAALADCLDFAKGEGTAVELLPALCGVVVAAVVGYFTIKFLLNLVKNAKLHYFSIYCLIVGAFAIYLNIM